MSKNYFYKGKLVGQDCYFCNKRVKLNKKHKDIFGPISYVAHIKCCNKILKGEVSQFKLFGTAFELSIDLIMGNISWFVYTTGWIKR